MSRSFCRALWMPRRGFTSLGADRGPLADGTRYLTIQTKDGLETLRLRTGLSTDKERRIRCGPFGALHSEGPIPFQIVASDDKNE